MVEFRLLLVGEKFKYKEKIWVKTKPKQSGCCNSPLLYNAHVLGNKKNYKIFRSNFKVEKIND